jgi:hypothetical protein
MNATTLTRPNPADEQQIEAASHAAGGPLAYVRHCTACGTVTTPTLPGQDNVQRCGNCDQAFAGAPFTWSVRQDPALGAVLILRRGDHMLSRAMGADSHVEYVPIYWRKMQRLFEMATAA